MLMMSRSDGYDYNGEVDDDGKKHSSAMVHWIDIHIYKECLTFLGVSEC